MIFIGHGGAARPVARGAAGARGGGATRTLADDAAEGPMVAVLWCGCADGHLRCQKAIPPCSVPRMATFTHHSSQTCHLCCGMDAKFKGTDGHSQCGKVMLWYG